MYRYSKLLREYIFITRNYINKKTHLKQRLKLKDANITDYEKYLSLKLGYKVEIKFKITTGSKTKPIIYILYI